MTLDTPRLLLRPLRLDDLPVMTALLTDATVHPWVWEEGPPDEAQVKGWIARKMLAWAQGSEASWAIVKDDAPVGYVTLHGADRPIQALSLAVAAPHRRQGFAREAILAVLEQAGAFGATEVVARVHHENPASAELLLSCGFEERPPILRPARREFHWVR